MKLEKGKFYWCYDSNELVKATDNYEMRGGNYNSKVAIKLSDYKQIETVFKFLGLDINKNNLPNIELHMDYLDINTLVYGFAKPLTASGYKILKIEDLEKFSESIGITKKQEGKKDSNGKLSYELDWEFIQQMAERMESNKHKYPKDNWKKPIDIEELKQGLARHFIDIQKGIYEDDGRALGGLEAIACNVMMISYQLKHNSKNNPDMSMEEIFKIK